MAKSNEARCFGCGCGRSRVSQPNRRFACLLEAALQRALVVVVSVPLLFEYEAVLKRDSQVKANGLTDAELDRALQLLTKACDKQALHFLWRPQLQDVADEMVLETAINARVDMLVTFNQRHLHAAAQRFNLRCVRPSECLHELEKLP